MQKIIDSHCHLFPDNIAAAAVSGLEQSSGGKAHADGTAAGLQASMRKAGIEKSIILPVATGGDTVSRGEINVNRRGVRMPLGLNVNHVTAPNGKIIGAITIFTDLTREKEMNARIRESDRLAAIGELAASIAHEIRNPLASIRGSVEILAGELELEGYQDQLLGLVLKESARVNTIINDFLAYSRMPAARKSCFGAEEFRDQISLQINQHVAAKDGRVQRGGGSAFI